MMQTRIMRATVVVLLFIFLFMYPQAPLAQAVPCDNSRAEPVIPTNDEGEPLMPQEIEDDQDMVNKLNGDRLAASHIERCMRDGEQLVNHVIDFDRYVEAWKTIGDSLRVLELEDSILWSFDKGEVNLAMFASYVDEGGKRVNDVITTSVAWTNVTMGPSFSTRDVKFLSASQFYESRFPKQSRFQYAIFHDGTSFQRATFGDDVSFQGATFRGNVFFRGAAFVGLASFENAIFDGGAFFSFRIPGAPHPSLLMRAFFRSTFGSIWRRLNVGLPLVGATFGQNASFKSAEFRGPGHFNGVTFGPSASFTGSEFMNSAHFNGATFGSNASFSAAFTGQTHFNGATFGPNASLSAAFTGQTHFDGATFGPNASFSDANFASSVFFRHADFMGSVSFVDTSFQHNISFSDSTFCGDTDFMEVGFVGEKISFRNAVVRGKLNLSETSWESRVDFREAAVETLYWDSGNHPSIVKGVFDARNAKFNEVLIREVRFPDLVDFSGTKFGGDIVLDQNKADNQEICREVLRDQSSDYKTRIVFEGVRFEKTADFFRAVFQSDAVFVRNRFAGVWNLSGASFETARLCLSSNPVNRLIIRGEQLYKKHKNCFQRLRQFLFPSMADSRIRAVEGKASYSCADPNDPKQNHEPLAEIYATLEDSFRKANNKWAENEAWYLRKAAGEIAILRPENSWSVSWILFNLPSRYGIDLYRVGLAYLSFILLFANVYWFYFWIKTNDVIFWKETVKLAPHPERWQVLRFRPFEHYFQTVNVGQRRLRPFWDGLFLSGRVLLQLGLGAMYPRRPGLVCIATVEWLIGIFLLIHFLLAVKNTLPIALPFLSG